MAVICGYLGCQHRLRVRGECGNRSCPRSAAATSTPPDGGTGAHAAAVVATDPFDDAHRLTIGHRRVTQRWAGDPDAPQRKDRRPFAYSAVVPADIADWHHAVGHDLARRLEAASVAIARLDAHPSSHHLHAVDAALLRSEAVASSQLEGIRASHRRIAEASLGAPLAGRLSHDARTVHANITVLRQILDDLSADTPITVDALCTANATLLAGTRFDLVSGDIGGAGSLRTGAMWVGSHPSPRDADFIAPPHEDVPKLMVDLERFVARTDLPAVTQAGLAHAQFETIHPFVDGNGRIGRALISAVLRRRQLATHVTVPVSAALLADRDAYLGALVAYQQHGDATTWLTHFADACTHAGEAGMRLGDRLADINDRWGTLPGAPRAGSHPRKLLDHLIANPVLDGPRAAELLGTDVRQARRALDRLVAADVLTVSGGARNRTWRAVDVLEALDDHLADF